MKRLYLVPLAALTLAVPAYADAISVSPMEILQNTFPGWLPWVLVMAVVVLTALVVRKKKK